MNVMLAAKTTNTNGEYLRLPSEWPWPLYASPKLDGIRAYVKGAQLFTRSNKLVPNYKVQALGEIPLLEGCDGELILMNGVDMAPFYETVEAVKGRYSPKGNNVFFYIFDLMDETQSFSFMQRFDFYRSKVTQTQAQFPTANIALVHQTLLQNQDDFDDYFQSTISNGFEGVCLRHPHGVYKSGRSTLNEFCLVKVKATNVIHGQIKAVNPLCRNLNPATTDATGHTIRSTEKSGLVADEMLGSLIVELDDQRIVSVGTGFTEEDRIHLWADRYDILGKRVAIRHQPYGAKNTVRHPVFVSFVSH